MAQKVLFLLMLMVVTISIIGCAASAPTRREVLLGATGYGRDVQPAVAKPREEAPTPTGCKGAGADRYTSVQACVDALVSGECSYYTPKKETKEKRGAPPYEIKALVMDACVSMTIEGGNVAVVPQRGGTLYRSRNGALFARNDCGNSVGEVFYVSPPPPPPVEKQTSTAQRNVCAEKGYSGEKYFTGIDPETGRLDCLYVEEVSSWDTKTGTVIKVVAVVAVVAGICKAVTNSWSCGVIKHHPTSVTSSPSPPSGPMGSNPFGPAGGWPIP